MTATGYCETQECFSIFVKHYDRLESDCVTDEDGRELGPGERVFVAIEPVALCEEHRGERRPVVCYCGVNPDYCERHAA